MLPAQCVRSAMSFLSAALLLLVLLPHTCHAFNLEKLCESRCFYGRGGNLCNCNAFHFAGKRDGGSRGDMGSRDYGRQSGGTLFGSQALLELFSSFDDDKYRDSGHANGGVGTSGSAPAAGGHFRSGFGSAGRSHDDVDDGDNRPDDDEVVEGFFGVEGHERSAVQRLASLLKAAIDDRLIDSNGNSRKWHGSYFPYRADGAVY